MPKQGHKPLRFLITSGATREPVDSVRFLSNLSTGTTGAALADSLVAAGHQVFLLRGEGSVAPKRKMGQEIFSSARDLEARLRSRLGEGAFDAAIMCAAVADYRPARPIAGKIRSDASQLILKLVRNPKILPKLRGFSPSPLVVIGFKLTVSASKAERLAAVNVQLKSGRVDAVIHNDLVEIRASRLHPFHLFMRDDREPKSIQGIPRLAKELPLLVREHLSS